MLFVQSYKQFSTVAWYCSEAVANSLCSCRRNPFIGTFHSKLRQEPLQAPHSSSLCALISPILLPTVPSSAHASVPALHLDLDTNPTLSTNTGKHKDALIPSRIEKRARASSSSSSSSVACADMCSVTSVETTLDAVLAHKYDCAVFATVGRGKIFLSTPA